MTSRRNALVYGLLLAIWVGLIAWQIAEYARVKNAARALLVERARSVAMTCGRIMRAPGRLVLSKEMLEDTIVGVVRPGDTNSVELRAVVLVNRNGDIAAAAPTNVDFPREEIQNGPNWDDSVVWLPNLVDLGTNLSQELVVLPRETIRTLQGTNQPGGFGPSGPPPISPIPLLEIPTSVQAAEGAAGPNSSAPLHDPGTVQQHEREAGRAQFLRRHVHPARA